MKTKQLEELILQSLEHELVMTIDAKQETPGRKVVRTMGEGLLEAMKLAQTGGDPAAAHWSA
jgi:hypothetical protein